jgi:lipopolysaccharide/colanic/teichoic acid biosynthesis glycosyltransferase
MQKKNYLFVKKAIEFVIALVALILLAPLMLIVAAIIKLESKGPAVYRSKRVGQDYRIFDLLKFRTMAVNADRQLSLMKDLNQYSKPSNSEIAEDCPFCKLLNRPCSPMLHFDNGNMCENKYLLQRENSAAFHKIKNDPRVTRFGKFLRMTSIDELPQLINVLKGEMSIIGNRPLPLYEAEKLTYDDAIARFNSPAGLTGLWQVTKRGTAEVSEAERIELDIKYAKTWSLKTDLMILLKTIPALFQKENV